LQAGFQENAAQHLSHSDGISQGGKRMSVFESSPVKKWLELQASISFRRLCFYLTIAATLLFLFLVHLAMWLYKGGTIHHPDLDSYSFTYNFFSDLGRNHRPGGGSNFPVNLIFKTALTLTGGCIVLFFVALPGVFKSEAAKGAIWLAALLGIAAGISYVGLAWVPYDLTYRGHRMFVRVGFISFLLMSLFFALAIFLEKNYPKLYGYALLAFSLVLFSQILFMFLGERSWRSNEALFRQATAQKVVVYAEILCMIYQTSGVLKVMKKRHPRPPVKRSGDAN
jgi:hypothetical membrane protein